MKRNYKISVIVFLLLTQVFNVFAQTEITQVAPESTIDTISYPGFVTVGLCAGTAGFGVELKKNIGQGFVLRLGYNHLPFSFTKVEQVGNVTINGYYKARYNNWHLFADYEIKPIKFATVRAVVGVSYFPKANVKVHVTPIGSYKYGEIELNDGTMGDANLIADWRGFAPYIGIGIGKAIPKTKMNFCFDIGTYYFTSSAKVDMVTSGYLEGNEVQREQIQTNLKSYCWLPTFQISLNYKF